MLFFKIRKKKRRFVEDLKCLKKRYFFFLIILNKMCERSCVFHLDMEEKG